MPSHRIQPAVHSPFSADVRHSARKRQQFLSQHNQNVLAKKAPHKHMMGTTTRFLVES